MTGEMKCINCFKEIVFEDDDDDDGFSHAYCSLKCREEWLELREKK